MKLPSPAAKKDLYWGVTNNEMIPVINLLTDPLSEPGVAHYSPEVYQPCGDDRNWFAIAGEFSPDGGSGEFPSIGLCF